MTDQASELLPCPFCGKYATMTHGQYYRVQCSDAGWCHATTRVFTSEADAVTAWNTRPPSERPAQVREALEKLADKISAKVVQLQHYRDHGCQWDHARIIAEGRLQQAQQLLHWVAEAAINFAPALTAERPEAAVAWRWRPKGASRWIYDIEPQWLEEHKHEIEVQPLYTTPHEEPGRETWWKILADNWRGRNGNSLTGDSVRNSCADELEKVAKRHLSPAQRDIGR